MSFYERHPFVTGEDNQMAISISPVAGKEVRNFRVSLIAGIATAIQHSGGTNLSERKWMYVQNASKNPIYIGSRMTTGTDTDMTAYELAKFGIKIKSGGDVWLPIADSITPYARLHNTATVKSGFLRVMELA